MPPCGGHGNSTPYDMVDDELIVTTDVEPLDPELNGNVQTNNEGFILRQIVCCTEM
jgi:hypothetical protein